MFYVYSKHIDSGRVDSCGVYLTMKAAVEKIRLCYNIDANCCAKNEYYYYVVQH